MFLQEGSRILIWVGCNNNVDCRGQLYVDDPSITVAGTLDHCAAESDLLLLWWLALGFRLSWEKGSHSWCSSRDLFITWALLAS